MANDGIYIKIDGDSTDYQKSIDDATKSTKKFDETVESSLDGMKKKFSGASDSANKLGESVKASGNKMGRMNNIIGQAGFQIQDLTVQLQQGTSAFVALGQQGSQMAGAFGPGGAVFGAFIAIGAAIGGVLASAMTTAKVSGQELVDKIDDLSDGFKDLAYEQREWLRLVLAKEMKDLDKEMVRLSENIETLRPRMKGLNEETSHTKKEWIEMQAQLATLGQEFKRKAETLKLVTDGYDETAEKTKKSREEINRLIQALEAQVATQGMTQGAAAAYIAGLDGATESQKAQIVSLYELITAYEAEQEAKKKKIAEDAKLAKEEAARKENEKRLRDQLVETTTNQLLDQEEMAAKIRQSRLDALEKFSEEELAILGGKKEAEMRIEKEYNAAITKIQKSEYGTRNQLLGQAFGNISSLMNTENKKLFEIGKAAAIAQATISGYEAAVYSYKWGAEIGGPLGGAAAAAASLVATGVQIANIASTQFGSKSAPSTNTGGGSSSAAAVAPTTQQNVSISLTGDTFTRGQVTGLIDQINEAIADGAEIRLS